MGDAPFDSLAGILETKIALLVLDTCEHLIEGVSKLANTLLQRCPRLTILATSRTPLDVAGEAIYRLPSLSLPPPGPAPPVEDATAYDAIALFVDRALASAPEFRLLDENVESVVEVCRRVDGIALAIEIAAARMNVLTPASLAWRLNERFHMLRRGSRTAFSRHQTMRALIDWSHDMLDERERALFDRVSVFANGWNASEAAAHLRERRRDRGRRLRSALGPGRQVAGRDRSRFVRRAVSSARASARLCRRKLAERGERAELRRAHAEYFLDSADFGRRPSVDAASQDVDRRHRRTAARRARGANVGGRRGQRPCRGGTRDDRVLRIYRAAQLARRSPRASADARAPTPRPARTSRRACCWMRALPKPAQPSTRASGIPGSRTIVARARELNDPRSIASAISVACHGLAISGDDLDEALVDEAIAHARTVGDGYLLGRILGLGAYLRQRAPEQRPRLLRRSDSRAQPYGDALCASPRSTTTGASSSSSRATTRARSRSPRKSAPSRPASRDSIA